MKLAIVTPLTIRYIANGDLTVREDEHIKSWLQQWTVPNNHEAMLVDLDSITADPFTKIVDDFMQSYRSVIRSKPDEEAVLLSFKFTLRVLQIEPGEKFWPTDGRTYDLTLKQMQAGLSSCMSKR